MDMIMDVTFALATCFHAHKKQKSFTKVKSKPFFFPITFHQKIQLLAHSSLIVILQENQKTKELLKKHNYKTVRYINSTRIYKCHRKWMSKIFEKKKWKRWTRDSSKDKLSVRKYINKEAGEKKEEIIKPVSKINLSPELWSYDVLMSNFQVNELKNKSD